MGGETRAAGGSRLFDPASGRGGEELPFARESHRRFGQGDSSGPAQFRVHPEQQFEVPIDRNRERIDAAGRGPGRLICALGREAHVLLFRGGACAGDVPGKCARGGEAFFALRCRWRRIPSSRPGAREFPRRATRCSRYGRLCRSLWKRGACASPQPVHPHRKRRGQPQPPAPPPLSASCFDCSGPACLRQPRSGMLIGTGFNPCIEDLK